MKCQDEFFQKETKHMQKQMERIELNHAYIVCTQLYDEYEQLSKISNQLTKEWISMEKRDNEKVDNIVKRNKTITTQMNQLTWDLLDIPNCIITPSNDMPIYSSKRNSCQAAAVRMKRLC